MLAPLPAKLAAPGAESGPENWYSSPGRPGPSAAARSPVWTSAPVLNRAENAFLKLLVFSRTSDGSALKYVILRPISAAFLLSKNQAGRGQILNGPRRTVFCGFSSMKVL